jgi:hypothetical protein
MESPAQRLSVLMPILDDWESAVVLVDRVHAGLAEAGYGADFLLVDDGSTVEPPPRVHLSHKGDTPAIEVLRLRRNLGHQRAIGIGLCFLQEKRKPRAVVVMDGDGEDTPEGVLKLIKRLDEIQSRAVVFGARRRRTEGLWFRVFYWFFRQAHRLLTGRTVRVGNFSVVPAPILNKLVAVSELWNHYAASVFKARIPTDLIPIDRGHRIAGQSRMNFVSLLVHGLSAVSVFGDVLGLRLLVATCLLAGLAIVGIAAVLGVRIFTDFAIPGWATSAAGVLTIILLQAFLMLTVFVFITLQGRSSLGFLPVRDYSYFVDRVDRLETDV